MIRQILPDELADVRSSNPDAILLDVRQPWEHATAAIARSRLMPLGGLLHLAEQELPEKERTVIIYCHDGIRSMQACTVLAALGYSDIINLIGGIDRYGREVDPSIPPY